MCIHLTSNHFIFILGNLVHFMTIRMGGLYH